MQHWVIFSLRVKKHHMISTKDLQKVFKCPKASGGQRGQYMKKIAPTHRRTKPTFAWFLE